MMNLKKILKENKKQIIKKWFDAVVETYPSDTAAFLKRQKDPFANPVGGTTIEGLDGLFDQLCIKEMDPEKVTSFLDPIIRIRAIQSFTPSKAVGFVFYIKKIIRDEVKNDPKLAGQFRDIETGIDQIALYGFDIYMKCREQIYEIRANEAKRISFSAFERAGLLRDKHGNDPGLLHDAEDLAAENEESGAKV